MEGYADFSELFNTHNAIGNLDGFSLTPNQEYCYKNRLLTFIEMKREIHILVFDVAVIGEPAKAKPNSDVSMLDNEPEMEDTSPTSIGEKIFQ